MATNFQRTPLRFVAQALFALAAAAGAVVPASADDYPTRPIRLIVPFAPGGVTDTGARVVADRLGQRLGQQVVVDNRPGASGNIGTQMAAVAPPDGYTLVLGFDGTLVINPHVYGKVPFDPVKDFAPVSKIGDAALIIVTHPSVPAKTFEELVAYSKSNPAGVSYGSAGTGSTPHLAGELLKVRTGANFVHVPYKGGGQAMADVVGGSLPMLYTAVAGAYPFVQKGQVNAIAVSSTQRLASLPKVPTVAESGVPGFESSSWIGILAPAKTPQPIVDRLQREIHAVVHTPEVKERLAALGITASGNTSAEFGQQIQSDLKRYAEIVKTANIKVD
ncbi:tripartite tricarboxylate transporter substrate binding protein [Variovorax sp. YR216]|uniref:Bug family tripartite tricarboxylate transporter substrate binding protein n=1 Tax=Variovorax sp. YR216 TaxID=1882828 RepID=UPI00089BBE01|nr:tripartite tricarboxylate transporter substrate binding protein [Variovorax sp. YR216]SEA91694.1 Tripartite-type tricarboxylate transporter, receptor component TctC [Variovorax sp. YR216]